MPKKPRKKNPDCHGWTIYRNNKIVVIDRCLVHDRKIDAICSLEHVMYSCNDFDNCEIRKVFIKRIK